MGAVAHSARLSGAVAHSARFSGAVAREIDSAWGEAQAQALAGLARCDLAFAAVDRDRDRLAEALEILRRTGEMVERMREITNTAAATTRKARRDLERRRTNPAAGVRVMPARPLQPPPPPTAGETVARPFEVIEQR